jgi:hypothetical protein
MVQIHEIYALYSQLYSQEACVFGVYLLVLANQAVFNDSAKKSAS